ncbi:MAG: serine/threonine-protein kinase [Polyangiaceae bacterium]
MSQEHDGELATEVLDPHVMRARARVGSVLHRKWRLDVLLGVGGMAAVYAATHRNGSRAAVKILHPELSIDPDLLSRFLREGYVANSVGHDGAVKVIDDDLNDDGSAFLVMELLDGETLEERRVRRGGRLSEDEVLSVADQLLGVLHAAHAKGIVHRDIKPENLFLTRSGQVKVLDFGIARLRELSSKGAGSAKTRGGSSMGTPDYMAPEQARGLWDQVDARTDLWAVGASMFHLLGGTLVHNGRSVNEVLLAAMTERAPPLVSVAPKVSTATAHVVDRALAFTREARWGNAREMQEAVRHAFHGRHGAAIGTAPQLTVPETVPNRTISTAPGPMAASLTTTGQPVHRSRPATQAQRPGLVALVALAAVVAAGIGLTSAVLVGAPASGSAPEAVALPPAVVPAVTAAAITRHDAGASEGTREHR